MSPQVICSSVSAKMIVQFRSLLYYAIAKNGNELRMDAAVQPNCSRLADTRHHDRFRHLLHQNFGVTSYNMIT